MSTERTISTWTEFAEVAGVARSTVYKWRGRADFPVKGKTGWPVTAVREYVKARMAEAAESQQGEHSELKAERLRKQIERLDVQNAVDGERLKQEQMVTDERAGQLVRIDEVKRGMHALGMIFKNQVESLRSHQTAKNPALREAINTFCDHALVSVHDALESDE